MYLCHLWLSLVKELTLHLPVSEIESALGAAVQTGSVRPAFA